MYLCLNGKGAVTCIALFYLPKEKELYLKKGLYLLKKSTVHYKKSTVQDFKKLIHINKHGNNESKQTV